MNKQEFLSQLRKGISGLPQEDIEEQVAFYSEMIDDRMEEGLSEAEAVEAIGPVDGIVSQIIADTPITKLVKEKIRPKKKHSAWVIILLVIGSPVWLSLLIAASAVILSLYAVLWAVIISFWAVFASLAVSTLGGIAGGILLLFRGNIMTGLVLIGAGGQLFISRADLTRADGEITVSAKNGETVITGGKKVQLTFGQSLHAFTGIARDKAFHLVVFDRGLGSYETHRRSGYGYHYL